MSRYHLTLRVVTISGRVLPTRTVSVAAESEAEALDIARGICQLLERGPVRAGAEKVQLSGAVADMTLEQAIIRAVTGDWS